MFVFTAAVVALVIELVLVNKEDLDQIVWPSLIFVTITNMITVGIYLCSLLRLHQTVNDFSHKTPSEKPIMIYCALLILNLIGVVLATLFMISKDTYSQRLVRIMLYTYPHFTIVYFLIMYLV